MYELLPTQDKESLFFKMNGEVCERHGAIGYLRADFGVSGQEFWTAWFNCRKQLNTTTFKCEFDKVISGLRAGGKEPPFRSRVSLESFCAFKPGKQLIARGSGYLVRTEGYSFYVRCLLRCDAYDIFCFAYDNRWLLPELAGQHELPDTCYSIEPSTEKVVIIKRDKRGFYPCKHSTNDREYNKAFAAYQNKKLGVTRAQEEAMLTGCVFGWHVSAAKPWRYDADGTPRKVRD